MPGRRFRGLATCDVGSPLPCDVRKYLSDRSVAQRSEARANFFRKELRLFPGRIVSAFVELVEIDELVIGPLCPAARGLIVLTRKDAHGGRDGDVSGVVKAEVQFPIEASRGNRRIRQPIERKVVEHIVSRQVACGVSMDGTSEHG